MHKIKLNRLCVTGSVCGYAKWQHKGVQGNAVPCLHLSGGWFPCCRCYTWNEPVHRGIWYNTENVQAGQFVIIIERNNFAVLELDVLYGLSLMTVKDGVKKVDGDLLPLIFAEDELEQAPLVF